MKRRLDRETILRATEIAGGIDRLGEELGVTGRQVRNYLRHGVVPKLAAERILLLVGSLPPDGAPPAQAGA